MTAQRWLGYLVCLGSAAIFLLGGAGCESDRGDDDLQALLQDREIPFLTRGALTVTGAAGSAAAPVPGAGATGGAGGAAATAAAMRGHGSGGATPPPQSSNPIGRYSFDDCNADRTELFDSGPDNHVAFRSVGVTCQPGIASQAVSLADREDLVYVPDQPDFVFPGGITIAAWFKPAAFGGVQTLARKRDQGTSTFALLLNGKQFQFVVNLGNGRAASASAPAKAGQFTHVAGTYDGVTVRLYLNGVQAAATRAVGTIENGEGPLLIGNDGSERLFTGLVDNAFVDRRANSAAEVLALTCLFKTPTVRGTPAVSAPTFAGGSATFDFAVTNRNSASCDPEDMSFIVTSFFPGISIDPQFLSLPALASGATTHVTMVASPDEEVDPGTFTIAVQVFPLPPIAADQPPGDGQVDLVVATAGCRANRSRELMIRSVSVVEDPIRTTSTGAATDPRTGAWTFKRLVENMAPKAGDAPAMVEAMLRSFTTPQTINTFVEQPRPLMQSLVLDSWPRTATGALDLSRPPLSLNAIVNRVDLSDPASGDGGEGRFVFGVLGPDGSPLQFTIIFEYKLPAATPADATAWATAWHALGALPFPSERYNAALQAITDRFTARNARPGHVNGNAINLVGTNEIDLDGSVWQLRQFTLSPTTKMLVPSTTNLTPDSSFNNSSTLADFINQNEAALLSDEEAGGRTKHVVPLTFAGAPFLGGGPFNDLSGWVAPGIVNNEARHKFSVNTCNGCHSLAETGTFFLQINARVPGTESGLSAFLTGTTVFDPVTGEPRTFNEIRRRALSLEAVVCH